MPRVLVVEDELHIAEAIIFNLEAEGFDVEHVPDGEGAVSAVMEQTFVLVLMGIM